MVTSLLTQPNMYVRGILFGKMKYELGDHSYVKAPELDLVADIEFKTKGYFTGSYDAIGGYIKKESTGENLYELSGKWNEEMWIKNLVVSHLGSVPGRVTQSKAPRHPDWSEGAFI